MNILYMVARLDDSDEAGDVERDTRYLTLNGHKICVASEKGPKVRNVDEVGARHYPLTLKCNIFSILADIVRVMDIISRENIRIVHAMDGISSFVAFIAARLKEKIFISTVYEHERRSILDRTRTWAKRVISQSESETRHFARDGIFLQEKVCFVPPSIDMDFRKKELSRLVVTRKHFAIGAVLPSSSPEKMQSFVKAVSIFLRLHAGHAKFSIVIKKDSLNRGSEEKLGLFVKRHLLTDVVTLIPEERLPGLLLEADLFVQVNPDKEIFARTLLLAASYGIPTVTTDAPWLSDYVVYGSTASVCKGDNPQEMAEAMLNLYKNEESRTDMARVARDFVRDKFDVKKVMEAMQRIYEEAESQKNILVIKLGALGDIILSLPSIRAIRNKFPNARIKVLTEIDKREIFANSPYINDVMVCDLKGRDKGARGLLRIASKLRYEDFDMVIDLQNNKNSHILSFLSWAPKRYGYDNGKFSFLLNRKIKDTASPLNPISHQARILKLAGILEVDSALEMWTAKEDEEWAEKFLESHWVDPKSKIVAINLGSSLRWATKLWPVEYFVDIANTLSRDYGARILIVGSGEEKNRAREFLKYAKCKPINALGKTTIPKLAAMLRRSSVLITSDSAPLHIAASVNTPVVALFGPTNPERHLAPLGEYEIMKKNYKCIPCYSTHCNRGFVCMKNIKPDEVCGALRKLLEATNIGVKL